MQCDASASQDFPLETSVKFSVKISNSKKKTKSSKNGCMSVLTIGNSFLKPKQGEVNTNKTRKCKAISSVSAVDEYPDDTYHPTTSKRRREQAPAPIDSQSNETDDELEAMGFAIETTEEPAIANKEHTLHFPVAASTNCLTSSSLKDFTPINLLTSLIPEMYCERYPKPVDTTNRFVCKWCKPKTRMDINKSTFKESYRLVRHYLKHHKDIPLQDYGIQCKDCSAYFFHEKRLEKHLCQGLHKSTDKLPLRRLTKDISMKRCSFCDIIFFSQKRYNKHLLSNGCKFKENKPPMSELGAFDHIECKFCGGRFFFEQDYQVHLTPLCQPSVFVKTMGEFKCRKVSLQYYECPICLEKYKSEIIFLQHIHHDHTIEEYEYRCARCKKPFLLEANYKEHVSNMSNYPSCIDFDACRTIPIRNDGKNAVYRINRERGTILYPCPWASCSSVYSNSGVLNSHIQRHTDFTQQWKCEKCQMTFLTEVEYEDHITKWKCPFCLEPQIFSLRRLLVDHCSKKHRISVNGVEKMKCNVCNIPLESEKSLLAHQQKHHSNVETVLKICPFCGVTDERVNLYRHIKGFHAYLPPTEKQFSCGLCENKSLFTTKESLKRHIGSVHKKLEITECDVCHKTFAQKATMLRHRRIHLDIKPFKCEICDLSFTQKTGMRSHKERHYNKDGTLKSAEEIKQQVEIIKEQREKQNAKNKSPSKSTSSVSSKEGPKQRKRVKKSIKPKDEVSSPKSKRSRRTNCHMCGSLFSDVNELNFHKCNNDDDTSAYGETTGVDSNRTIENNESDDFMCYKHRCDRCLKDFVSEERMKTHRCLNNYRKVLMSSNDSEKY